MDLIIKQTEKEFFFQTENLTREAFWNLYQPGCDVHLILHNIRKSKNYIGDFDLAAFFNQQIIGHIITTKAKVIDLMKLEHEILSVGPISVLPEFQNKGVGTKLIEYSISLAKKSGFVGMILFGNPNYYHRFGFKNAKEYEITTKDSLNFEPFMALQFQENGMDKLKGKFYEDAAYMIDQSELVEFEKKFPKKEKKKTETQFLT
ncbi:GNAT family N-acetyltransferase [Bacteroidota bacterium]